MAHKKKGYLLCGTY